MIIICGFQIAQRLVFSGTFPLILNWAVKLRITFLFLTSGIAVNTNDQRGRLNSYRWPHYKTNCDRNRKYYCTGAESRRLKSNKHILVHLSGNLVVFSPSPNLQTADWLLPQLVFPTKETFQDSSEARNMTLKLNGVLSIIRCEVCCSTIFVWVEKDSPLRRNISGGRHQIVCRPEAESVLTTNHDAVVTKWSGDPSYT